MIKFFVKMCKFYELFVVLGVLGHSTFCRNVFPLPYKHQNADYSRKLFDSFFNNVIADEARNDTATTIAVPTTSKPTQPTTEDILIIPLYEEAYYDPNYYAIPPYPVFYNSPLDSQLQFDDFVPSYPVVNDLPSVYSAPGIQSLPYFNPNLINAVPEKVVLPSITSDAISRPTDVKPLSSSSSLHFAPEIQSLPFFNTNLINAVPENRILSYIASNAISRPANEKPSSSTSLLQKENTNGIQLTDAEREALLNEMNYLIEDFILRKQLKTEQTSDDGQNGYKTLNSSSTSVPQVSTYPDSDSGPSVVEDVIDQFNETNKFDKNHLGDITAANGEINEIPSSSNHKELRVNTTAQSLIETNQSGGATPLSNETDASRKLDLNFGEVSEIVDVRGEFTTTIPSNVLTIRIENNRTSANNTKLNDRFIEQPTTWDPSLPEFVNVDGKNCFIRLVKLRDKSYQLLTCPEKSFDGKHKLEVKTTDKSDVTYFTEELPTTSTETESAPTLNASNSRSFEFEFEERETATLNTVSSTTYR